MITVYLKNGESAPLPDGNLVKLDEIAGETMLHCFLGDREVGQFKWTEVAGYAIAVIGDSESSTPEAYRAWGLRNDR